MFAGLGTVGMICGGAVILLVVVVFIAVISNMKS